MQLLNDGDIQELLKSGEGPCLSIYLPLLRKGTEVRQNRIRFKNLLDEAEERLSHRGLRGTEVRTFLEPLRGFPESAINRQPREEGLAFFRSPGFFRHFSLPASVEPLAAAGEWFHVKLLVHLLRAMGTFYVLALGKKGVRLLQGNRHDLVEVELDDLPQSLAEALWHDDPERQLQFHTGTPGVRDGKRAAVFHGQGAGSDEARHKVDILRYLRIIEKELHVFLRDKEDPLVLAGVKYLPPLYREVSNYPHLAEREIAVNPDSLSLEEIHCRAWEILEPIFRSKEREDRERHESLKGSGSTLSEIDDIVKAAAGGRVDCLFAEKDRMTWGRFDPVTEEVIRHDEPEPNNEDLLNLAVVHTLLNGGTTHVVDEEDMPAGSASAAAVLRY